MNQSQNNQDQNIRDLMRLKSLKRTYKLSILFIVAYTIFSALSISSSRILFIALNIDCYTQTLIAKLWFIATTTYYILTCQTYILLSTVDYTKRNIYFKWCLMVLFIFQFIVVAVMISDAIQNYIWFGNYQAESGSLVIIYKYMRLW